MPETRSHKHQRPRKTKKRAKSRKSLHARIVLWSVLIVFVVAVAAVAKFSLNKTTSATMIFMPRYSTSDMLADSLQKHVSEDYAKDVMFLLNMIKFTPDDNGGAYYVGKGETPLVTAWRLFRNRQSELKLTINHVRTLDDLIALIASNSVNSKEDVRAAMLDTAFLNRYDVSREQVRMLFLDDTYNIFYKWNAQKILDRIARHYQKFWNEERQLQAQNLGLSPKEVMIVASIADEESNMADEKGKIGRLYINRLNKGMRLQADPTVKFAVGDFSLQRITGKYTSVNSPYNTYKFDGLPPGPLCTTSARTVDAVLQSKPSSYLYMCAKEDFSGYHNFATTFEEHNENARRYQQELNRRNIR